MNKVHKGLFINTSNEVIWPKKFKFHSLVKKCHFGNFTRNWPISWIGHALLIQPSISPLVNNRKWLYQLLPIKYELRLPSKVKPGLLPFRSRSKHCDCRVHKQWNTQLRHREFFYICFPNDLNWTCPFKVIRIQKFVKRVEWRALQIRKPCVIFYRTHYQTKWNKNNISFIMPDLIIKTFLVPSSHFLQNVLWMFFSKQMELFRRFIL